MTRANDIGSDPLTLVVEKRGAAPAQSHPRADHLLNAGDIEVFIGIAKADHEITLSGHEQARPAALSLVEFHLNNEPFDLDPAMVTESRLNEVGPEVERPRWRL